MALKLQRVQRHLVTLLKQVAGPSPQTDSVGGGWGGALFHVSNQLVGEALAAGLQTTPGDPAV